jgi:hypothetical protein
MVIDENDRNALEENLVYLRLCAGLSTADLGLLTNTSKQNITNIEMRVNRLTTQNYIILRLVFVEISKLRPSLYNLMNILFNHDAKFTMEDEERINLFKLISGTGHPRNVAIKADEILGNMTYIEWDDMKWYKNLFVDIPQYVSELKPGKPLTKNEAKYINNLLTSIVRNNIREEKRSENR